MSDTENKTKEKTLGRKLLEAVGIFAGVGLVTFGIIRGVEFAVGHSILNNVGEFVLSAAVGAAWGMLPFATK